MGYELGFVNKPQVQILFVVCDFFLMSGSGKPYKRVQERDFTAKRRIKLWPLKDLG